MDSHLRQLERQAALGDEQASLRLAVAQRRLDTRDPRWDPRPGDLVEHPGETHGAFARRVVPCGAPDPPGWTARWPAARCFDEHGLGLRVEDCARCALELGVPADLGGPVVDCARCAYVHWHAALVRHPGPMPTGPKGGSMRLAGWRRWARGGRVVVKAEPSPRT